MSRVVRVARRDDGALAAAALFRALAHPMRVQIVYRLLDGEMSVTGLETELGLRQPNLSQQLGQLREAKLVTTRREAKSVFYSLTDDRVRAIVQALRGVLIEVVKPARPAVTRQAAGAPDVRPELSRAEQLRPSSPRQQATECGVFAVVGLPARGQTETRGGRILGAVSDA
jgi:ArsR family transcriptional regulator